MAAYPKQRCTAVVARHALQSPVDRLHAEPAGRLGSCPQPRLVELHDVRAGRLDVTQLLVHDLRECERQLLAVAVVLVLRLRRERERPRHRHLDRPCACAQELGVAPLDRAAAADRPDDARHLAASPPRLTMVRRRARTSIAVERRREVVGVALAPDLAVADDVDSGALISRTATSVASSCASCRYSAGTRQMPGMRTRGTRVASNWRSTSQSGCG